MQGDLSGGGLEIQRVNLLSIYDVWMLRLEGQVVGVNKIKWIVIFMNLLLMLKTHGCALDVDNDCAPSYDGGRASGPEYARLTCVSSLVYCNTQSLHLELGQNQ